MSNPSTENATATPGPWTIRSLFVGPLEIVAGDRTVAMVAHEDWPTCEANAVLMAASPALLEAAEEALALLQKGAPGWGVAKDLLRAAIHKAKP